MFVRGTLGAHPGLMMAFRSPDAGRRERRLGRQPLPPCNTNIGASFLFALALLKPASSTAVNCEQAATIGAEKDFCQCGHASCWTPSRTSWIIQLSSRVNPSYARPRDHRMQQHVPSRGYQLRRLAEAIDVNHEALRATVENALRRFAASEGSSPGHRTLNSGT